LSNEESEELEQIAESALRFNRKGSFEQMLANQLILSVNAEFLHKIRLVIEAVYMSDMQKLQIDKETLNKLYAVTISFLGTSDRTDFISVAWNFTESEQNYLYYIKEWIQPIPLTFVSRTEMDRQRKQRQLDETPTEWQRFFLVTKSLSLSYSSLNILRGLFYRWALPQVMVLFEKLAKTIDPNTYREILSGIKGEKAET
jgi:hypothetical protein